MTLTASIPRMHDPNEKYARFRLARKYLHHYMTASNGHGHGVHSPFVFELITCVLNDTHAYPAYGLVEGLRKQLLADQTMVEVDDLGAGSQAGRRRTRVGDGGIKGGHTRARRTVAEIARHAAKPPKWGRLLYRLARFYQFGLIVELGTSLGLSAGYLSFGAAAGAGDKNIPPKLYTIEGAPAVAAWARENFRRLGVKNREPMAGIEVIAGGFDDKLPDLLERIGAVDLAFVDGNHRYEPTMRYFDMLVRCVSPAALIIFDDIHWSPGMEQAWADIKKDHRVMMTVDLFFMGLVFFSDDFLVKQDFCIRF